ncbi:hypothetical protein HYR69_06660 [Candidatus Sumerlaeota bacterium]|nr:hypothetical protein [Candidatus Sumerlaeota bacterium]
MAAFARAIEAGADMIELDVSLSKDGAVVVIHDDTLDRTTNGAGPVAGQTLRELRRLDAGSWFGSRYAREKIPTLREVLRFTKGSILLNIEIKPEAVTERIKGGIAEKVIGLVRALKMDGEVIISSFDSRAIIQVDRIDPDIWKAILYDASHLRGKTIDEIFQTTRADALNLDRREVTGKIVKSCHQLGRPVSVYTVDDPREMERLIKLGVDAIFTNRPDEMIKLLQRLKV